MTQIKASEINRIGNFRDYGFIEIGTHGHRYKIRCEELLRIIRSMDIVFDVEPKLTKAVRYTISQSKVGDLKRSSDKFKITAGDDNA